MYTKSEINKFFTGNEAGEILDGPYTLKNNVYTKDEINNIFNQIEKSIDLNRKLGDEDNVFDKTEEVEKTESLDSIYILEKEPDISIEIDSLPFEPDFAYVANNSLFFGEKENLKPEKVPIRGDVLSFTWSPDRKFIYLALKTELNEITKKEIEKNDYELEAYDLKIYKFDFKKPSKAEYITTLYDRTSEYPEDSYFLTYGDPNFDITCLN